MPFSGGSPDALHDFRRVELGAHRVVWQGVAHAVSNGARVRCELVVAFEFEQRVERQHEQRGVVDGGGDVDRASTIAALVFFVMCRLRARVMNPSASFLERLLARLLSIASVANVIASSAAPRAWARRNCQSH